ncbi:hypothetical protein GCM10011371_19960 [Novosphingobium marinum]|uniref:DUF4440 domain-containing protein n=1 Tax=Novosphingobium marinum TaxID=1514948 RepID=A0A7Z0BVB7_9SPHN|nr:hypothetical protein [Novosphingobium marinum]NYH96108.1 hypothetical protein [Novosphingobium marinum]GGC32550.1 hypothetical protein GCM10011371_19960 [Novosphingobium marinum]
MRFAESRQSVPSRLSALSLPLALLVAGCAAGPQSGSAQKQIAGPASQVAGKSYANPTEIIGAEVAANLLAEADGQWTALGDFAAEGAVMFVPQPVLARQWLNGRPNPVKPDAWRPHVSWVSCDGTLGAAEGAWQGSDGTRGYFVGVWQLQPDGEYKWVMRDTGKLAKPLETPEMLAGTVADCGPLPPALAAADPVEGIQRGGASTDGTLRWSTRVDPWCGRIVTVSVYDAERQAMETVVTRRVDPPLGSNGKPAQSCTG